MSSSKSTTLAITNGIVVNEGWLGEATVLLSPAGIVGLQEPGLRLPSTVEHVVDARDQYVLPGAIDPHCHVQATAGDYSTLDNFEEASVAALFGGTTTLVDFAIPHPGERPVDAVRRKIDLAQEAKCDVALHGCVTEWWDDLPAQIDEMWKLGISTIKLFTTYRHTLMAAPHTQKVVIQKLNELGGLPYIHAESNALIEALHDNVSNPSGFWASNHPATRPELTESAAVHETLALLELLGSPGYFVHQTTPEAVDAVARARSRGANVYSETCPHYLLLNEQVYAGEHPERFVCCPPLRPQATVDELRQRVLAGTVDTIGSDHNCFSTEQKLESRNDTRVMPNGLPGVELRVPVMFSEYVATGLMSISDLVRIIASNPAKLIGKYPKKGVIAPGSNADVVVFDPNATRVVSSNALHMKTDYTPFDGWTVRGWPSSIIKNGSVIISDGQLKTSSNTGGFVKSGQIRHDVCV